MRLHRLILGAAALLCGLAGAAGADALGGRYRGMQDAAGAELVLSPAEEGYAGTFSDAAGRSQEFAADAADGGAEAVLDMDGRTVVMRVTPLPFGAEVALVPVDPDGRLQPDQGRVLHFLREGLEMPEPPQGFVPPPGETAARIGASSFLASYEFWPPSGVRNGYVALAPRHRTIIRLFAPVQLDIIWKLCLAEEAGQALGMALRGQGVSCEEVVATIAATQRDGRFDAYKARVADAKGRLAQAIRCADGYVESKTACDAAAREVSAAAQSLETAGSELARFR